tara:strand:- start:292 stop:1035 length:744 start_codon:yes stop_codon:yes gene_type:complete
MLKIVLSGSTGKMGIAILNLVSKDKDYKLIGGVASESNSNIGKDLGEIAGEKRLGVDLSSRFSDLPDADVLIDFSEAKFSLQSVEYAKKRNMALVLGTTGHQEEDLRIIEEASQFIPLLKAPNTSVGIAYLKKVIDLTSESLSYFNNLQVLEKHHKDKKDLPSGTSIDLANFLSERILREDSVNIESKRTGDNIAGEHKIILSNDLERVELSHKVLDRTIYAEGALIGAKWLQSKTNGLYDMSDIYS